jgi:hypothetical protein
MLTARGRQVETLVIAVLSLVVTSQRTHGQDSDFWTAMVQVMPEGASLRKTAGCEGCDDAGAVSVAQITGAGEFVEFTPTWGHRLTAGLNTDTTNNTSYSSLAFAFNFWADGGWDIRENNVYRKDGAYTAGDVFKITIEGTSLKYYRNGSLLHTSEVAPTFPLVLDTSLFTVSPTASLTNARVVTGPTAVEWTNRVNTNPPGNTLEKTSGCGTCFDAGAISVQQISGTADVVLMFEPSTAARFFVGFGNDTSTNTERAPIKFAFSFWETGGWDVRESDTYRTDGTFVAGDLFKIAIEGGVVKYYKNQTLVHTSQVIPTFPLVVDTSFLTIGATVSRATFAGEQPSSDPYTAISHRDVRPEPPLVSPGPAGSSFVDPLFGSTMHRVTDANTRPGAPERSYRSPSNSQQNAWSSDGRYFYVVSTDGTVIPYAFDAAAAAASRIQPVVDGDGGFVLDFAFEPQFSYATPGVIYGTRRGPGATLRTIDKYDFVAREYSPVLNLDTVVMSGLEGTLIGGIGSSNGPPERLSAFFGGTSQDQHHYAVVFEAANTPRRTLVDTLASTVDGNPTNIRLDFRLHHVAIDRTGRYVLLYPTGTDREAPRNAAPVYVWDTTAQLFTELVGSARPYGHHALGFGQLVNQDCCTSSQTWDPAQWQFRSLGTPFVTRDLIQPMLPPPAPTLAEHPSWNNAQATRQQAFLSGLYRYGDNSAPWRAWDGEIVAVQTDAPQGTGATVWRFAHHRSNVARDTDPLNYAFWYTPRPNVSPDGRWSIFTSNWEKTLGLDPGGQLDERHRQDVFLVNLR